MGRKPGRPPVWPKRQLIDGIRWRTRTGAPWRDGSVHLCNRPWSPAHGE
ncbi:transposase [Streptomyces sp. NPDC101145]